MTNFNDAKITSLFVSQAGSAGIQDDAPNAPAGGSFNVTLEMEAGTGLQTSAYTLIVSCEDVTAVAAAPALVPTAGGFASAGAFGTSPGWGAVNTFSATDAVTPAAGTPQGHVYQYTAAVYNKNGQVVSSRQSDLFVLI
jgi:hypothetical protein